MLCKNNLHELDSSNIYIEPNGTTRCRICRKEYRKNHYLNNKEQNKINSRKWANKNRNLINERLKHRRNTSEGKIKRIVESIKYRNKNIENIKKYRIKHYLNNSTMYKMNALKRKALKLNQLGTWEVPEKIAELTLYVQQQGLCFYCQGALGHFSDKPKQFHLEHKIPLCRGGLHSWFNVVLSCINCNLSKGKKTIIEFKKYLELVNG